LTELSFSQKFFICAVNDQGHISNLHSSTWTCLILSALIDLEKQNCIAITDPHITITSELPQQLGYLAPAVERLMEQSPISLGRFVGNYVTGLTETARQELFESIGRSLVAAQVADATNNVVPTPKVGFIPHPDQRRTIIETVLPSKPDDEQIIFASLVHHGKLAKNYFSRSEQKCLKETLAQYHHYSANEELTTTLAHIDSVMNVPVIASLIASTGN
jgi:hypothetical protein